MGDEVKQYPRAERPWMTSARDLTDVPLTVFCLPSQPKQGHEVEQGRAILMVLSPSQATALQAPTPLPVGSRHCTKTTHQSQQRAPAFTPAPHCCQRLPREPGAKKRSHQPGWAGAIADTLLGSLVVEQLCLSYKLLVLPAQLSASQLSAFRGPAHQNGWVSAQVTALWKVLFWENSPQPPQISWI